MDEVSLAMFQCKSEWFIWCLKYLHWIPALNCTAQMFSAPYAKHFMAELMQYIKKEKTAVIKIISSGRPWKLLLNERASQWLHYKDCTNVRSTLQLFYYICSAKTNFLAWLNFHAVAVGGFDFKTQWFDGCLIKSRVKNTRPSHHISFTRLYEVRTPQIGNRCFIKCERRSPTKKLLKNWQSASRGYYFLALQ